MLGWKSAADVVTQVERSRIDTELTRFAFEIPDPRSPTPEERAEPEGKLKRKRMQQRVHKRQVRGAEA